MIAEWRGTSIEALSDLSEVISHLNSAIRIVKGREVQKALSSEALVEFRRHLRQLEELVGSASEVLQMIPYTRNSCPLDTPAQDIFTSL